MKKINALAIGASAVLMSALLAACGGSDADSGGDKLVVASIDGYASSIPIQVGMEKGIFSDHDINLTYQGVESGPAAASLVSSGAADIGYIAGPQLPVMATSGVDVKFLGDGELSNIQVIGLASERDENATAPYPKNALALKGKKLATPARGSAVEALFRTWLSDAGMDPDKDVTFIATGGPATTLAALKNGAVQFAAMAAPTVAIQIAPNIDSYVLAATTEGNLGEKLTGFIQWQSVVLAKNADKRGALLTRYCEAMVDVHAWMKDPANKSEVEKIAGSFLKLPSNDHVDQVVSETNAVLYDHLTKAHWDANAALFPVEKTPAFDDIAYQPCAG